MEFSVFAVFLWMILSQGAADNLNNIKIPGAEKRAGYFYEMKSIEVP